MKTIKTFSHDIGKSRRTVTFYQLPKISEVAKRNGWINGFKKVVVFAGIITTEFYYTSGEYDELMKQVYKSNHKII